MFKYLTPDTIIPPFAKYSHGVEVPPGMRLIFCSGQLGLTKDAYIPEDTESQTRLCFENVESILKEAGLGMENIVRINAYVTGREHLKPYMKVRDELFSEPAPASTLMIVSGFAREVFTVEIEVIAAGP
ncbi:MAG: RidA family protein [Verrucomicrobiota bacterium]